MTTPPRYPTWQIALALVGIVVFLLLCSVWGAWVGVS